MGIRLRDGKDVPFTDWSVTEAEWHWLFELVKLEKVTRVLEFGPGASTWAFLEAGCEVVTVEQDGEWWKWWREKLPCVVLPRFEPRGMFELGFVDGPPGHEARYSRLDACLTAAECCKMIALHDTGREGEMRTLRVLERLGWQVAEEMAEGKGLTLLTRRLM